MVVVVAVEWVFDHPVHGSLSGSPRVQLLRWPCLAPLSSPDLPAFHHCLLYLSASFPGCRPHFASQIPQLQHNWQQHEQLRTCSEEPLINVQTCQQCSGPRSPLLRPLLPPLILVLLLLALLPPCPR